ncbi:helix-turn-helix transcriptional regulator [Amycolatopsis ultiminotia]|uniref:Helix-turn-helix transcriptional regulator n=2 Tax=Amycolatopsis ultiminotia TaxID=543629 RepID=A0ABP6WG83_9PSEU
MNDGARDVRSEKTGPSRNLLLSIALRAAREEARFGLRELGRRVGVNPALLSNWELGQRTPRVEDVAGILGALGVVGEQKRRIMHLVRTTGAGMVVLGDQSTRDHLAALGDCAALARSISVWHPLLIPDVLQIPDYSKAVLVAQGFSNKEAYQLATIRAESGNLIIGPGAKPITAFIGTAALTEPVGTPEIMGRQLGFLDNVVATSREVVVRIVPENTGWHPGLSGPFTLFATPPAAVAHFSHHRAGSFVPDDGGEYRGIVERLEKVAKTPLESAMLIEDLAATFAPDGHG